MPHHLEQAQKLILKNNFFVVKSQVSVLKNFLLLMVRHSKLRAIFSG